jgi:hypothetical protein
MLIEMIDEPIEFSMGKEVFVILGPDKYSKVKIKAYRGNIFDNGNGKIVIKPDSAKLSIIILSDYFQKMEPDVVSFKYLTNSEKEAKRWSKFVEVDIPDKVWSLAIGKRETTEEMIKSLVDDNYVPPKYNIEDSELGVCCSNISAIRDILTKCWENKGLTGWEIEYLQDLMNIHEPSENTSNLLKILNKLDIIWE